MKREVFLRSFPRMRFVESATRLNHVTTVYEWFFSIGQWAVLSMRILHAHDAIIVFIPATGWRGIWRSGGLGDSADCPEDAAERKRSGCTGRQAVVDTCTSKM